MDATGSASGRPGTRPRRPALNRGAAMRLAAAEYDRFAAQLRELRPGDWSRPTACLRWDIHAMSCHVLSAAEFAASPAEQLRQVWAAKRRGGFFLDELTALQVEKHQNRTPSDIVARLAAAGPKAAKGRKRTPSLIRGRRLRNQPVDDTGSQAEDWTVGYLTDVILTRDTWMHRSDISLAAGRQMRLTADHDGVLVADVAAEWAQRHGEPCNLTLTGPAGGSWAWGNGGPALVLDAVEFCRILSGRRSGAAAATGLLAARVPF